MDTRDHRLKGAAVVRSRATAEQDAAEGDERPASQPSKVQRGRTPGEGALVSKDSPPREDREASLGWRRLLDFGERGVLCGVLVVSLYLNAGSWRPVSVMLVVNNAITVLLVLFRRPTNAVSAVPSDWLVAFVGTLGAMFLRPGGSAVIPAGPAGFLALSGFAMQLAAKLSLNRRFGIGPANRGIQARWVYGIVRHPMYLGYLLIQLPYVLLNLSLLNVAIFAVAWTCQVARILREERFLSLDPEYRRYAQRVRFRLVPMLF